MFKDEKLVPFKKYETITESTNGEVDDLHYSEKGQSDLAFDFVDMLNQKIKTKLL